VFRASAVLAKAVSKTELEEKIIVLLTETICVMSEIDKVIDKNGGWPRAFTQVESK